MKLAPLAAIAGLALAAFVPHSQDAGVQLVISGDALGYLSPCGCSKPMIGGMKRKATVISNLASSAPTLWLENGGYVERPGAQNEMKAQTLALLAGKLSGKPNLSVAVNLSGIASLLGDGLARNLQELTGGSGISEESKAIGPFLLKSSSDAGNLESLLEQARNSNLAPALMIREGHEEAVRAARQFPTLAFVIYRSAGAPGVTAEKVGNTLLLSPGDRERFVLSLKYKNGEWSEYKTWSLGEAIPEDAAATSLYRDYLTRVSGANLIEQIAKKPSSPFAGSKSCQPCHAKAAAIWAKSSHASAYRTLITKGNQRDPDCVSCHVVGLGLKTGFVSAKATPHLQGVGCESCHGPSKKHVQDPRSFPLGKVGKKSCNPCHVTDHSPGFVFETYWPKIAH